jgi:hypothetical protein
MIANVREKTILDDIKSYLANLANNMNMDLVVSLELSPDESKQYMKCIPQRGFSLEYITYKGLFIKVIFGE